MWLGGGILALTADKWTVFVLSLVPYLVCMVFASKLQSGMLRMGLCRHGGGHVVVAMFILNPFVIGFYVPLSVLLAYRKALRQLT